MNATIVISESIYTTLYSHLYPKDRSEVFAFALCGRLNRGNTSKLFFYKLILATSANPDDINTKNNTDLESLFVEAERKQLSIVKIKSRSDGQREFSNADDILDNEFFEMISARTNRDRIHASLIMLPDGALFGRYTKKNVASCMPVTQVILAGENIVIWRSEDEKLNKEEFNLRTEQLFGPKTIRILKHLTIGIVGCSGTGSPTIEQLTRLGVGKLVLVDPDEVEEKNLNRIINSKMNDAIGNEKKVDVLKKAIDQMGLGTEVVSISKNLYDDKETIQEIASCDIIFGCVDSVDGRHLLNLISSFYLIPYFDLGVKLVADGHGGIDKIVGSVHYIKPGGGSLMSRGVYTSEELRAASMHRLQREEYEILKESGYISNTNVDSPAVISINMTVSSFGVNEFLARIHPFRSEPNKEFDINRLSLSDGYTMHEADNTTDIFFEKYVGRGEMNPLLNLSELT